MSSAHLVERLNWAGLGVVKVEGRERCVPLTRIGERVEVNWREGDWGRVIGERIDRTPREREALDQRLACPEARRCSGCSIRHLTRAEQASAQTDSHLGALKRLSNRPIDQVPTQWVGAASRDGYRERITASLSLLHHGDLSRWTLSIRSRWGEPVDLTHCPNHPPLLRAFAKQVSIWASQYAEQLGLIDQDGHNPIPKLTRVSIQAGSHLPSWVILHLEDPKQWTQGSRTERTQHLQKLSDRWDQLPLTHLVTLLRAQSEGKTISLFGQGSLKDQQKSRHPMRHLGGHLPSPWQCPQGLTFSVTPPAWLPQSPSTLILLRKTVQQALWGAHSPRGQLFELGCGVGAISLALLASSSELSLIGVDIEDMSVTCASKSAELNGLAQRAQFLTRDGRRALAELGATPDWMIVHAMRKPISGILSLAAQRGIPKVCYLAPSAPSLGRDLAEEPRYQLDHLYLIDQMPGTAQLMTIAELTLIP